MSTVDFELSRISKLIMDHDQISPDVVLARRQSFGVTLCCGDDVAGSYTLQLAALLSLIVPWPVADKGDERFVEARPRAKLVQDGADARAFANSS